MKNLTSTIYPQNVSVDIESSLLSFSSITNVPITYYDMSGEIQCEYHSQEKICKFLPSYNLEGSICKKNLLSSITIASQLGEPYIFQCGAGLINIGITIFNEGSPEGCLIAGPIIMEKLNQRIMAKIISLNMSKSDTDTQQYSTTLKDTVFLSGVISILKDTDFLARVLLILKEMKIYSVKNISNLATLLNNCILANVLNYEDYKNTNNKYKEQVKLGNYIQTSKRNNKQTLYPSQLESLLIHYIKTGNSAQVIALMEQYLDAILIYESGKLEQAKIHLIELCALISRACNENSHSFEAAVNDSFTYINMLNKVQSINELATWSKTMVDFFTTKKTNATYKGNSQIIIDVLSIIANDYTLKLSLSDVANILHLNPSYLSTHFKKEMGKSFTQYLVKIRIEKAKYLLQSSKLGLVEIAMNCGFEDQSYFTKVFKKETGLSPKQYRISLYK